MRGSVIIAVVALLIILTVGFVTGNASKNTTIAYQDIAQKLELLIENREWQEALKVVLATQEDWEARSSTLQTWIIHSDVDTVTLALRELKCAVMLEETFYAMAALEEFREGAAHIYHRDAFRLKNIL